MFLPREETLLLSFDTEAVDDYKDVEFLLVTLDKYDMHATFFVTGDFLEKYPSLVQRMITEDHEVGCHTLSHPYLPFLAKHEEFVELNVCKATLESAGVNVLGFRAPYRLLSFHTFKLLRKSDYNYDASFYRIPFLPKSLSFIREIPTSTFFVLPLDDYVLLRALHLPEEFYFYILQHHPGRYHSFSFHPRIIAQYPEDFDSLLAHYADEGLLSLRHRDCVVMDVC